MKRDQRYVFILLVIGAFNGVFLSTCCDGADAQDATGPKIRGVEVELTESFYKALKNETDQQERVYGQAQSDEYLRKIAVSTQYLVETNMKLIQQQEKMIELLERLVQQRKEK